MRTRWQLLGAAVLVSATAATSALVAARHERAVDRDTRAATLAKVRLSVVPFDQVGDLTVPGPAAAGYGLAVRNDGPVGVVLRRATWLGGPQVDLALALPVDAEELVVLPEPGCPKHRLTEGLDHVDVQVEAGGGRRTVRLELPDPQAPVQERNGRCGLFPAAQSVSAAVETVEVGRGQVQLDVRLRFTGSQPVEVVAARGAEGIEATVVEALPLTLSPTPDGIPAAALPHVLTVRLRLRDCAPLQAQARQQPVELPEGTVPPPRYDEVQLDVRHPGEPVEQVNLGFDPGSYAAACHLPPRAALLS